MTCEHRSFHTECDAFHFAAYLRRKHNATQEPIQCDECGRWRNVAVLVSPRLERFIAQQRALACDGKCVYTTEQRAERYRVKAEEKYQLPFQSYQCDDCGKWHLKTQEKEKEVAS